MPIRAGSFAPDFVLYDQDGKPHRFSDYRGREVVLYFYPKDDTPGCVREACNFRDDYSAYQNVGITILGVSPDSVDSHQKFHQKYDLPFPILSDTDHVVCDLYGVWGRKKFMGKEYDGVLRTTFVIDQNGVVKQVFEDVKPATHSSEILASI